MARYFIHLAYNGASYCGWQTQPGLPTVQLTLEQALSTLLRQPVAVVGCGRGVHASDFYAHFDVDRFNVDKLMGSRENVPTYQPTQLSTLIFKLNNVLPPDIAVFDIFPVADNAHARFDATARTYQYHVSDRKLPFRQGLCARIYYNPDLDLMNRAAEVLMEYDDFTSFAKLHTEELVFTIRSNRFLRNMVRSVTGTLLDVGRGKLTIDGLREIIEKKDRCAAGVSMPPQGLFLTKVEYPCLELRVKN